MKHFIIVVFLTFTTFICGIFLGVGFLINTNKTEANQKQQANQQEMSEKPTKESQTDEIIEEIKETVEQSSIPFELELAEHSEEMIDYGYIKLEDCIPLADITGYYYNEYDYPCFELSDIWKQFDDVNGISYQNIMDKLPNLTEEYKKTGIIK